ncbi:MAG TPA: OsmC family peroxiredoxin [Actinomycetota bacterium]
MATEKRADVTWRGDLATGRGTIERVGSGVIEGLGVSWAARTGESDDLTSPEELIAAAHASCFSMALSKILADQGHAPDRLLVTATVSFVPGTGITRSALDVTGVVPGMEEAEFGNAAEAAKENCPVSQALKGNVELTVASRLS